eukprot:47546-Chlamydomonas_euryale.AAC.1
MLESAATGGGWSAEKGGRGRMRHVECTCSLMLSTWGIDANRPGMAGCSVARLFLLPAVVS